MSAFLGMAKSVTRIFSQTRKELIQIIRRPAAFLSLVLGPFLLMALSGPASRACARHSRPSW